MVISAIGNHIWKRLAGIVDEDLLSDPRFVDDDSRYRHRDVIRPVVEKWVALQTASELVNILEGNRVPCGRVNGMQDIIDNPQLAARDMVLYRDYPGSGTVPVPGVALKLSETPGSIEADAPALGEHNEEIYCNLIDCLPSDLGKLHQEGVI